MPRPAKRESVGLPARPFLYTLDQVATMLGYGATRQVYFYVYFEGRATGLRGRQKMLARNIAPEGERPDWRIAEQELIRWLKVKGFHIYEQKWLSV